MWQCAAYFALGAVTPTIVKKAAPYARSAVKSGIVMTAQLQESVSKTATQLREDLQDIVAEASAELDSRDA